MRKTVIAALLAATLVSTAARAECDVELLQARLIFVHAGKHCERNHKDGPVGFYTLAMARQCKGLPDRKLLQIANSATNTLDGMVERKGKTAACQWVDELEKGLHKEISVMRAD